MLLPWSSAGGGNSFLLSLFTLAVAAAVVLRAVLSYRSLLHMVVRSWRWLDEKTQVYQYYDVPRYGEGAGDNPLFRKAAAYIGSLPGLEDSDASSIVSSASKSNEFSLQLGPGQTVQDSYHGARLAWKNPGDERERLVLRVRRQDRTRVLRPYLQHVESVADEIDLRRRELRLYTNSGAAGALKWTSVAFTHPATLETVAMDPDLKTRVRADLESFLKGRAYYNRLGRVWRRSYLLYGPPGTGKSTFAAAMARFLGYDIYDVDFSRGGEADLRALLLHTTPRSLILVEDLDRYLNGSKAESAAARMAGLLNFMDGISSCCGEERVMVFTMSGGKEGVDPAVLRPGRLDVHISFPMCDFEAFKVLANNYLGLKDHKLYPQVEEGFQNGGRLSPAEVGEIMIANRGSPSRALRTVIGALQHVSGTVGARSSTVTIAPRPSRINTSWSGPLDELSRGSVAISGGANGAVNFASNAGTSGSPGNNGGFTKEAPIREFKKLYGLIKIRSRKEGGAGVVPVDDASMPVTNSRMSSDHSGGSTGGEKEW